MKQQLFKLKEGQAYVQLNNLLQILQFAQTGGHAKIMIRQQEVIVNGQTETRVRKKLSASDEIQVGDHFIKIESF